jgi:hypothetical protein
MDEPVTEIVPNTQPIFAHLHSLERLPGRLPVLRGSRRDQRRIPAQPKNAPCVCNALSPHRFDVAMDDAVRMCRVEGERDI